MLNGVLGGVAAGGVLGTALGRMPVGVGAAALLAVTSMTVDLSGHSLKVAEKTVWALYAVVWTRHESACLTLHLVQADTHCVLTRVCHQLQGTGMINDGATPPRLIFPYPEQSKRL